MINRNVDVVGRIKVVPCILKPLYKLFGIGIYSAKFYIGIWDTETRQITTEIFIRLHRKSLEDITEIESDILSTIQDTCIIHEIDEVDLIAPKITYSIAHALSRAMVDDNVIKSGLLIEKYYNYIVTEDGLIFKRR